MNFLWANVALGTIGLLISFLFTKKLLSLGVGRENSKQVAIWKTIKEASFVYLKKQYTIIWSVAFLLSIGLFFIFGTIPVIFFFIGVLTSTLAGFYSMFVAVNGNVRTVEGAKTNGLKGAFSASIYSGASASIFLNSLGILSVIPAFFFKNISANLICIIMGVSLVSIFARLGGGIFTKGADVGADLVGKTQLGLAEDDPRNPATIADNVGDNVGDVAGMGADLCETYVVSIASSIMLGFLNVNESSRYVALNLCSAGLISSIIPILFMKFKNVWEEMGGYFYTTSGIFTLLSLVLYKLQWGINSISELICVLIGSFCVLFILKITEYYTSSDFQPVKNVSEASKSGGGSNVIFGLAYGFESTVLPVLLIIGSVFICFKLSGVWGIALGVLGITALSPAILLLDIFGPVSDNAGGIAEMSSASADIRAITDELDAVGNTTKAITKGYAIGSAIFASLIMFYFFQQDLLNIKKITLVIDIFKPIFIGGLFLGCLLPFAFSGFSMKSVSKAATAVVEEVKSQVEKNPKILTGEEDPDYKKTVNFLTTFAIKEMILPSLLPVMTFAGIFISGFYLQQEQVFILIAAVLIGVTLTGSLLSIFMTVSGGLWDNAKKYVEQKGKKGSDHHKSAVIGDTVGDPFKDTVGPSLNSFIKFTNVLAIIYIYC